DPYGKATFLNASWGTLSGSAYAWRYLFQGGRYDTTSGLYDFQRREDSPTLGRWVQIDPLRFGAGDADLYRYAGNDATDPSGLWSNAGASAGWIAGGSLLVPPFGPYSPAQFAMWLGGGLFGPASRTLFSWKNKHVDEQKNVAGFRADQWKERIKVI